MHKIIVLWSHPRSMSTAMERIMRERGDLWCAHEPFMYDYYVARGAGHMPKFDVQPDHPTRYEDIRDMLLQRARTGPVFFKDMAYYVVPRIFEDPDFFGRLTHSFLIRNPMASLLSYHKLDPGLTQEEVGIEAQWQLYQALVDAGQTPAVIEAEAVRADTRGMMAKFWAHIGLDWREEAFDWAREPPKDWEQVGAWHEEVSTSSGIRAADAEEMLRKEMAFETCTETAPRLKDYLAHHLPFYQRLARVALSS
ncbi:hypothetical protein PEL8287_02826 [Roseovarius litorisediminis]|uniref:Sulfotransferase family protein n=1 Tax=Roseovarius litorisediminis TaxID=1312363 RepID=A0A1Y5T124_9RHOB|nr:hypothetical protein [Roseovarius litorisediminis]SLN53008.1 hypothetical protein PEL8287_02826 [Roseovarius litorisediminis]